MIIGVGYVYVSCPVYRHVSRVVKISRCGEPSIAAKSSLARTSNRVNDTGGAYLSNPAGIPLGYIKGSCLVKRQAAGITIVADVAGPPSFPPIVVPPVPTTVVMTPSALTFRTRLLSVIRYVEIVRSIDGNPQAEAKLRRCCGATVSPKADLTSSRHGRDHTRCRHFPNPAAAAAIVCNKQVSGAIHCHANGD